MIFQIAKLCVQIVTLKKLGENSKEFSGLNSSYQMLNLNYPLSTEKVNTIYEISF